MNKSELIIQTAEHLFYQYGFKGVGVDSIRDASGCSKTTIYKIFSNKDNLIKDVLRYRDERFRAALTQFVGEGQGADAVARIMAWHHNWFNQPEFNGCLFVRSLAELNDDIGAPNEVAIAHKEWLRHFIFEKVQKMTNARDLADQLFIILEGQISTHLMYKNNVPLRERLVKQETRMIEILMGA